MAEEAALDCRWRASPRLLTVYLGLQCCATGAVLFCGLPWWGKFFGLSCCAIHGYWCLPRSILLSAPTAYIALRHDARGWRLFSKAAGWQPIQLLPDSIALPQCIILRFRRPGRRLPGALVLPADSMAKDAHRRLRVRLRFSRHRWTSAGA